MNRQKRTAKTVPRRKRQKPTTETGTISPMGEGTEEQLRGIQADYCPPSPQNEGTEDGIILRIPSMGVIQLHALIRSWRESSHPFYANLFRKHHNLLDVYNRAELQQKVAEALSE